MLIGFVLSLGMSACCLLCKHPPLSAIVFHQLADHPTVRGFVRHQWDIPVRWFDETYMKVIESQSVRFDYSASVA
jgi:hypothetical protein